MSADRFHFGPADPVSGRRGIDLGARMWIAIDWCRAFRECLTSGRPYSPVMFSKNRAKSH